MSDGPPTASLRSALEVALRVAQSGERADPVEPAPPILRPYIRFSRLSAPALEPLRRALEEDEEFRARVVEATSAAEVGEPAWLWLARPDGWEERLAELDEQTRQEREAEREAGEEQSARKRVVQLEAALRRAEAKAAESASQANRARDELAGERARRREAEGAAAGLRDDLARAVAERDDLSASLARTADELASRLAELEALRAAGSAPATGSAAPDEGAVVVDTDALVAALAEATSALARAAEAVSAAVAAVTVPDRSALQEGSDVAEPGRAHRATTVERLRRRPAPLPGGMFDDSLEAAEHLLRIPGVLLLVDGYNVSHAIWPGLPLPEQRARLVDALGELHARTGAAVQVVFDGAVGLGPWVAGGRHAVHVRFSAPEVEADDVLVEVVANEPPTRTVVLATSDNELRGRARRLGANLLGARQLSAAMRR